MGVWTGGKRAACACPLVTTAVTAFGALPARLPYSGPSPPRKKIEDWNAGENKKAPAHGAFQIIGERIEEKDRGNENKYRRHRWISPDPVGSCSVRRPPSKHEEGAACNHIKEPLGENSQREELPETAAQQEQNDRESRLGGDRDGRRVKARMNLGDGFKKISV